MKKRKALFVAAVAAVMALGAEYDRLCPESQRSAFTAESIFSRHLWM